jgi:predicted nucleic acid-binding Zn finger protein
MALSRRIYRLQNTDNTFYYVESETSDDHYYCVKYNPSSVVESWLCSCKDNSTRHMKCKHLFAIEFALKWGIVKDIDKLPTGIKEDIQITSISKSSSSYKDDDYTF